jgi:hypothetical protein
MRVTEAEIVIPTAMLEKTNEAIAENIRKEDKNPR